MIEKIKDNLKYIVVISILIISFLIIVIYFYINSNKSNNEATIKENKTLLSKKEEKKKEDDIYYYVDIKGAVNNEGVYKLKENSRVIDVINEAGGLKENADTSIINLSKKIFDEMFIVIYTKEEIDKYKQQTISTKEINEKIDKNTIIIDQNNDANIKSSNKKNSSKSNKEENNTDQKDELININTATKEELLTITGIGESKADSIITYREENGEFNDIEDIKNVSGIGDSLFEKIKEYITV